MDAYTEVGGRATQDAKAEVIGTTPWMGDDHTDVGGRAMSGTIAEVELRQDAYRDICG